MNSSEVLLWTFYTALLFSAIGFKHTVWFISIGYAASIVAMSILLVILYNPIFQYYNYIQIALLMIWGSRLGIFLWMREQNIDYSASVNNQTSASQSLGLLVKVGIWIGVSLLYTCMFSPAIFTLQDPIRFIGYSTWWIIGGLLVMAAGVIIESLADQQKTNFKKTNPNSYCNTGLFAWVRCPNYLGEIMLWLGNAIMAMPFLSAWWQWILVIIGLSCIVLIMMGSAKRLEKKQKERYGSDPKFQDYEKTVPILFPWTRVYTLQGVKVYLE